METKKKHELSLAKRMAISLVCGLVAGLAFMFLREHLNASGQAQTWTTINNLLFQDITAEGAERSFGIFYIIGQLFIKALQLVIIPMVFTSISLAIGSIADTRTMGRISAKTLFWFLLCSFLALLLAGCVGYGTYSMGLFNTRIEGLAEASGSTAGRGPQQEDGRTARRPRSPQAPGRDKGKVNGIQGTGNPGLQELSR